MNSPVVVIPGALTGIGRATALAFAKEGTRIVIAGRRDETGQNLVAELRRLDAEAEIRERSFVRSFVANDSPGHRKPAIFYDPRALSSKSASRASLHASSIARR